MTETRVLRDDDPECARLEASGFRLVAESWGAHLQLPDLPDLAALSALVDAACNRGYSIELLSPEAAGAMFELERATNADYPYTPATAHPMPTPGSIRELWRPDAWVFGAWFGEALVCAGSASMRSDRVEVDFGSVRADHRRHGVGAATAAHALIALAGLGFRRFATGGAAVNTASRRTVEALGFQIDEVWRSYERS